MKILIVNTSDINGGAARAAYRLHRALLSHGVDSHMLVQFKTSNDPTVSVVQNSTNRLRPFLDSLPKYFYPNRTKTLFSSSWLMCSNIVDQINEIAPDIVNLHWINGGMIRIEDLSRIKAPIVWSLHDMWPFTGGCHYDEHCGRYTDSCGNCPVLGSHTEYDLSRKIWNRKLDTYRKIPNLTIIGLSRWMSECAKSSSLFQNREIIHLPNVIDMDIFNPMDKQQSREHWNLPQDKKLILFGAMNATSDPRKGFHLLKQALDDLDWSDTEIVIFGSKKTIIDINFPIHNVGVIDDDNHLSTLYSAADVMVVPSLQENLSNAIMESLSCGTPVVAYNIGGNSDMIKHQFNGYLAVPFNTKDLSNGINWVLTNKDYKIISYSSRTKISTQFENVMIVNKYIDIYKDILHG